jgi:hypothetical protein
VLITFNTILSEHKTIKLFKFAWELLVLYLFFIGQKNIVKKTKKKLLSDRGLLLFDIRCELRAMPSPLPPINPGLNTTMYINLKYGLNIENILYQRFSNCGTRTTSGTRKTIRWYAKGRDRTEIKNLIFNS